MQRRRALTMVAGGTLALAAWAGCSLVVDTDKLRSAGTGNGDAGDSAIVVDSRADADASIDPDSLLAESGDGTALDTRDAPVSPTIAKVYLVSGTIEGKQSKEVIVADVRADGTLSDWTVSKPVGAAASTAGLMLVDGTVYVVGVDSNAETTKTVRFAKVDKGILGDWALDGSFPRVDRGKLGVAGISGFIFAMGGSDTAGVGVKEVLFAPLKTDGAPGVWVTTNALPMERYNFATAQWNDHVWVLGGGDVAGKLQPSVFHTKLSSTGAAPWTTLTSLSFSPFGTDAVVTGDHIYLLGGYGGTQYQKVWYTTIASDGTLGPWLLSSNLMTFGHTEFKAVAIGTKFLCAFGGSDGPTSPPTANAECAALDASGAPQAWKPVTRLPQPRMWHTGFAVTTP
jgi:hypothetical protein